MTTTPTPTQAEAIRAIATIVIEALESAGTVGIPAGYLYAALMQVGCTLSSFEKLMGGLVQAGRARKRGHVYYAVTEVSKK